MISIACCSAMQCAYLWKPRAKTSPDTAEALQGVLGIQGEGLFIFREIWGEGSFIFRDLGRKHNFWGFKGAGD